MTTNKQTNKQTKFEYRGDRNDNYNALTHNIHQVCPLMTKHQMCACAHTHMHARTCMHTHTHTPDEPAYMHTYTIKSERRLCLPSIHIHTPHSHIPTQKFSIKWLLVPCANWHKHARLGITTQVQVLQ